MRTIFNSILAYLWISIAWADKDDSIVKTGDGRCYRRFTQTLKFEASDPWEKRSQNYPHYHSFQKSFVGNINSLFFLMSHNKEVDLSGIVTKKIPRALNINSFICFCDGLNIQIEVHVPNLRIKSGTHWKVCANVWMVCGMMTKNRNTYTSYCNCFQCIGTTIDNCFLSNDKSAAQRWRYRNQSVSTIIEIGPWPWPFDKVLIL